jgi:hypothetical protein
VVNGWEVRQSGWKNNEGNAVRIERRLYLGASCQVAVSWCVNWVVFVCWGLEGGGGSFVKRLGSLGSIHAFKDDVRIPLCRTLKLPFLRRSFLKGSVCNS